MVDFAFCLDRECKAVALKHNIFMKGTFRDTKLCGNGFNRFGRVETQTNCIFLKF
jgi:hypothetical protein